MPKIYACYRQTDNPHVVGRVVGDLRSCFGPESVFYDVDSIDAGGEWPEHLKRTLADCEILLVFIGEGWHRSWDDQVGPRLWHPSDWVRREICEGIDSADKTVIPILIDGAEMPKPTALPNDCSLRLITERQCARVRHADYEADIRKLIKRVGSASNATDEVAAWVGLSQMQIHQSLDRFPGES